MKHCKTCENCAADPLCLYLKDLDYKRCVIDGHHIERPFWEKCGKYRRDLSRKDRTSSVLYQIIKALREPKGKSQFDSGRFY